MRATVILVWAGLVGGCAGTATGQGDEGGPEWWRYAADADNPTGGVWQAGNGDCLFVWYDRISWADDVIECDLVDVGGSYLCVVDGRGYGFDPADATGGYLGPIVLTFPEGRTLDLEPDCRGSDR